MVRRASSLQDYRSATFSRQLVILVVDRTVFHRQTTTADAGSEGVAQALQVAFGLRREEAIKFNPTYAMQSDHIKLKSSWTKGGRARTVPITSTEQRRLLEEVKALARGGALIPPHLDYVKQLHRYERQIRNAGLSRLHGLRHGYAQRRYLELTGWVCPVGEWVAIQGAGSCTTNARP